MGQYHRQKAATKRPIDGSELEGSELEGGELEGGELEGGAADLTARGNACSHRPLHNLPMTSL
jgi:hypothetical protein